MADEEFRLPLSSYDELVKIIQSYGHVSGEAPLSEVANIAGLHPTIVSRNNAFLVAVGIVEGGQRKVITELGKQLSRALEHNIGEDISSRWYDVTVIQPFFQKLLAAIRIRRGMDESTLLAHVAYSAGQKKSAAIMAGSAAVIQIMRIAGLIREDGDKLVTSDDVSSPATGGAVASGPAPEVIVSTASSGLVLPSRAVPTHGAGVSVTIQLNIQCTPEQLDEVAVKLKDLIARVTGTDDQSK